MQSNLKYVATTSEERSRIFGAIGVGGNIHTGELNR